MLSDNVRCFVDACLDHEKRRYLRKDGTGGFEPELLDLGIETVNWIVLPAQANSKVGRSSAF